MTDLPSINIRLFRGLCAPELKFGLQAEIGGGQLRGLIAVCGSKLERDSPNFTWRGTQSTK